MEHLKHIQAVGLVKGLLLISILSGCSFRGSRHSQAGAALATNQAAVSEESRALTTGVVDALNAATNSEPAIDLAKDFAQRDQQLEGLPIERIPVKDILAGLKPALDSLQKRFDRQDQLIKEKAALEAKLRETEASLIEMGKKYEAERNKHIVRRVWEWAIGTLGLGGLIVLCVFCPAVIPLIGSIIGWIVGKIPALASFFGVVSKKAFESVVHGVANAREALKNAGHKEQLAVVDSALKKTTEEDAYHRPIIDATRAKLA